MQVQPWCLQIPLPIVASIIVAAISIPNDLDVDTLLIYLKLLLNGLLSHGAHVVSYAADGTEVEQSIQ